MNYILIIVVLAALLAAFRCVGIVNGFRRKEIQVEESLSGIEVALTKRYDMLTKMLDTAKGYMSHERDLFTETIRLRSGMTVGELSEAGERIENLSRKFFAVAEGYPQLKSSEVFTELQRGIMDAEEHLQAARRLYNAKVAAYNQSISVFPGSLLAGGRQPKAFFRAADEKKEDVKIHF